MEIWKYGNMEIWKYGNMEIWKYGNMEIWKYGNMEIWPKESPERKLIYNVIIAYLRSASSRFLLKFTGFTE